MQLPHRGRPGRHGVCARPTVEEEGRKEQGDVSTATTVLVAVQSSETATLSLIHNVSTLILRVPFSKKKCMSKSCYS